MHEGLRPHFYLFVALLTYKAQSHVENIQLLKASTFEEYSFPSAPHLIITVGAFLTLS